MAITVETTNRVTISGVSDGECAPIMVTVDGGREQECGCASEVMALVQELEASAELSIATEQTTSGVVLAIRTK